MHIKFSRFPNLSFKLFLKFYAILFFCFPSEDPPEATEGQGRWGEPGNGRRYTWALPQSQPSLDRAQEARPSQPTTRSAVPD